MGGRLQAEGLIRGGRDDRLGGGISGHPETRSDFLGGSTVKRLPTMRETQVQSLGWADLLEKEMAVHSSILAWEIPWTEEPGRL